MKKSELQQLVKEELRKALKEDGGKVDVNPKDYTTLLRWLAANKLPINLPSIDKIPANGSWLDLPTASIKDKGGLQSIFTTVVVDTRIGINHRDGALHITLDFSWTHPRGSNGYTIRYKVHNGKVIE